jgi:uncharacterized RDD family membrane protein YckC
MPDWPIGWVQVKNEAGPGKHATASWLEICNTGGRTLDFTLHPAEKGDPMARLLVQEGNGEREFELVDLEINIGRELDNTLRLPDPSISRHHAVIRLGPAGYEIQDLQSSNGVLINGTKVASAPLRDGDRITLGQMQLTFVDPRPAVPESNPLGTVRMDPEAMARIWAGGAPPPAAPPVPAPVPAAPPSAAPPVPAEPPPAAPPASAAKPGPSLLHPYLPDLPDSAVPLRAADGTVVRGDFSARFLAGLIDASPMLALGIVGMVLTLGVMPGLGCVFGLLQLALAVAYLILTPLYWMRVGATPGKKIMKLRVVPERDPTGRIDLNAAIMRLLGYLANGVIALVIRDLIVRALPASGPQGPTAALPYLLSLVSVLPYLVILGPGRKALEDIFSRSIVIRVDR